MVDSIAANYQIILRDQTGEKVALFDNWGSLDYGLSVNGIDYYNLTFMDTEDPRFDMFELDSQVEILRTVPGCGLDWYLELEAFHRKPQRKTNKSGVKVFTSHGVGYNDLLARTCIAYKAGTVYADKSGPADNVMKAYVLENCGYQAAGSVRRFDLNEDPLLTNWVQVPGILPGFSVQGNSGDGDTWSGSRAFENLMDVLRDLADFSNIDFKVVGTGEAEFEFRTYVDQYGLDRTEGNPDGNDAVIFDVLYGNVQDAEYTIDRTSESNVVLILGKGEASTRYVVPRSFATKNDSPWNRREISRPATSQEFLAQMQDYGDEILEGTAAKTTYKFNPLQQPSGLYGLHYAIGDMVTVQYGSLKQSKKIVGIKVKVKDEEQITLEFADVSSLI